MANKEEISFVLNSNLDKIAQHAKILSQNVDDLYQSFRKKNTALIEQNRLENIAVDGIKKLSDNYSTLNSNVTQIITSNKNFVTSFNESNTSLSKLDSIIDKLNNNFSDLKNEMGGSQKYSFNFSTKDFEGSWEKVKKVGDAIHDFIKGILDGIHKIGAQLAIEAINLKPFALEFMSSFSFNPLKFFGFGQAMKESFDLMKMFQQMRHELAYLSDSSGDASKALSLVYEVAGGSAIASGTAQGVLRALADQGIIANGQLKSIGILSGNLQAATGIAASSWANFTGELAFNYGIPTDGLENITSALIGTNIRGSQLEKVMGTVNKVLQTTGFIAGVPTTESIHKLTKSIGGASKTFQSLGISAEKSGAFIEGIMDPENFEKNAFLFAKLGISASEYAGYLNDADGQQKLLQKTMQNLPQLASEISNIKNPFARIQFAKTIGLDMQIVQRMAGKTKTEIEQILADYEKENKDKEALEAKKQKMASEAAKFDDMMLALKLKVLGPVMQFLSSGYLDRFFETLPKIAETIGKIFAAMTPIIDEVTNAILEALPYVTKMVNEFLLPFIKMFPQILKGLLNLLPGMNLGDKKLEIPGPTATKEEIDAYNKERANNMFTMIGNVGDYLSKIFLILVGWKAFSFIGDMASKVIGFFSPGSKKLMDVTFDQYLDGMEKIQGGGGRGAGMGMLGKVLLSAGLIFGAGKIAKSYFSKENDTGINDGDFAERRAQSATASLIQNPIFGKGTNYLSSIKEGSKTFGNFLSSKLLPSLDDIIPGGAPTPPTPKVSGKLGSFKAGLKGFGALGTAVSAYQILTAENKEQLGGAIGGAIGGVIGGMAGGFLTPFIGPLGPIVGSAIGSTLGDYVGANIGQMFTESAQIAESKSKDLASTFETGMNGIFKAFKAGDFESITKMLSLGIERLFLEAKAKITYFIPFMGSEKKEIFDDAKSKQNKALELIKMYQDKLLRGETVDLNAAIKGSGRTTGIQKYINDIIEMESKSSVTGLSTQTKDMLINSINMSLAELERIKKERDTTSREMIDQQKEGNKTSKAHLDIAKKTSEDKKSAAEIIVQTVDFSSVAFTP
jgi:hypothetical protein